MRPTGVIPKMRKEAHMLIEDFMLLANRRVAEYLTDKDQPKPTVYRIHDEPNIDKLEDLRKVAGRFGHNLNFSSPKEISSELNKLTAAIKGQPEQSILENMAIIQLVVRLYYNSQRIVWRLNTPTGDHG